MPSASWSLQQAIFAALTADATLTTLLGGAQQIHDQAPQGAPLPYVTFGPLSARDWSTGTDGGEEHSVTLHVWSRGRGKKQAHELLGCLRASLHDRALSLSGHRLVNLRHEVSEARRHPDGETVHGLVRFRAVTEPA